MDDLDDLPPIESLSEQVEALKIKHGTTKASTEEEGLAVASVIPVKKGSNKSNGALARGFFDSKPKKATATNAPTRKGSNTADCKQDNIPFVKASASNGPRIPDFFKLEPDEQTRQYKKVKDELINALRPTPDRMAKVMNQPDLLAGFDDPHVMAAVSEVASNPEAMKKYANDPKVTKFYASLAKFMSEQGPS